MEKIINKIKEAVANDNCEVVMDNGNILVKLKAFKRGDVVKVSSINKQFVIYLHDHELDGMYESLNEMGLEKSWLHESGGEYTRLATPEEAEAFHKELAGNGLKWNGKKIVKYFEEVEPKACDFAIVWDNDPSRAIVGQFSHKDEDEGSEHSYYTNEFWYKHAIKCHSLEHYAQFLDEARSK